MRVGTALICDFASVRDGLLNVVGGGVTRIWRESFPAPLNICLALVFELHQMELDRSHQLVVQIMGEDGAQVAMVEAGFQTGKSPGIHVGEELIVPVALDLRNAGLPNPGAYSVEVGVDGTHQRTLQLWAATGGPTPDVSPGTPPAV